MDLRAIINNEAGDVKAPAAVAQQPATPSSSSQLPQSRDATSANASRLYNEYPPNSGGRQSQHVAGRVSASYEYEQSRQQSRNTSTGVEYPAQSRSPQLQFPSPTAAYQRPQLHSEQGHYASSIDDLLQRGSRPYAPHPSPSPLFPRTSSGPFSYQTTKSPGPERVSIPHQSSGGSSLQRQESYPQPALSQYITSPEPFTPPSASGATGGYPPYLQQQQHSRSLSAHSNSTPTSAHSQYNQSPLLASAYPAPAHLQQRSQPGTPLGPPISIHRSGTYPQHQQQYSTDASFSASPYQSRQSLPPPPPPSSLRQSQQEYERRISNESEQRIYGGYDGPADPRAQSQSQQILQAHVSTSLPPHQPQYERRRPREQSLSVSPKTTPATRVPSQQIQSQEPIYVPQPQLQPQIQQQQRYMSRDSEETRPSDHGVQKRKMDRQSSEPSDGRDGEPQIQRRKIKHTEGGVEKGVEKRKMDRLSSEPSDGRDGEPRIQRRKIKHTEGGVEKGVEKRKMDRQSSEPSDGRDGEPPMQRRRIEETPETEGETTTDERSPEQLDQSLVKREDQSQTPQPPARNKRLQSEDGERGAKAERPRKRIRYTEETKPIWARSWPEFIKFKKMYPDGKFHGVSVANIGGPVLDRSPQLQINGTASEQDSSQQLALTNGAAQPPLGDHISALLGLPWTASIGGVPPPAPITKQIADFLYVNVIDRKDWNQLQAHKIQIEVEAKLGTLIDKNTNHRLDIPVASECVLAPIMLQKTTFRSEMDEEVFKYGNGYLNDATKQSLRTAAEIKYTHRREVDTSHQLPSSALTELPPAMQSVLNSQSGGKRNPKVRVSHDQKTGKEIARIVKARVADLDVYFPQSSLDCRISVNFEMEFEGDLPMDGGMKNKASGAEGERRKDRLSYKQSGYTIDLTQVSSGNAAPTHELEIEIDTDVLVRQGRKLTANEPQAYVEFVEGMVTRMRTLVGELGGGQ